MVPSCWGMMQLPVRQSGGPPVPLVPQLFYPQAHMLPEETTHTSSSSFTTLAWALLRAWSRISMCRLWSSLVERAVASSASSFSFSRWLSLSIRTWNINTAIPELAQNLTWAKLTIIPITRRSSVLTHSHKNQDTKVWTLITGSTTNLLYKFRSHLTMVVVQKQWESRCKKCCGRYYTKKNIHTYTYTHTYVRRTGTLVSSILFLSLVLPNEQLSLHKFSPLFPHDSILNWYKNGIS